MSAWQDRSEIDGDVVFFSYAKTSQEKALEEIYVWDLDKTYLDTTIDSLSGLFRAIIERAFSKKNIPGTDTLLRTMVKEKGDKSGSQLFPIYFITASPPQMEERIFEKFQFDKIYPLGCFYKDNLSNLRPGRFWRLTKQVGYKLQALMQLRLRLHSDVRQICFGDDSESDVLIYNLYSDICARRLSTNDIREILAKLHVTGEQVDTILSLQASVPNQDPVERIYINLATDTDPEYYFKFGRRTLATYNTLQIALDMFQNSRLSLEGVWTVFIDMKTNYQMTSEEMMKTFDELVRRGVLGQSAFNQAKDFFISKGVLYPSFQSTTPAQKETEVIGGRVYALEGSTEPYVMERIDYLNDYR